MQVIAASEYLKMRNKRLRISCHIPRYSLFFVIELYSVVKEQQSIRSQVAKQRLLATQSYNHFSKKLRVYKSSITKKTVASVTYRSVTGIKMIKTRVKLHFAEGHMTSWNILYQIQK